MHFYFFVDKTRILNEGTTVNNSTFSIRFVPLNICEEIKQHLYQGNFVISRRQVHYSVREQTFSKI